MARSTYIYVVKYTGGEILAAFTVRPKNSSRTFVLQAKVIGAVEL